MRAVAAFTAALALAGSAFAQSTAPTPPPPAPQGVTGATLLPALVEHSRHVATLENGRLSGEGADFLRALGAQSQFVLIGEEHGGDRIAAFIEAYWRDLHASGYNYAAVEVDPWIAAAMERELRAGGVDGWTQFLQTSGGAFAAPFFSLEAEARLAATIVETTPARRQPVIWGLDQTFIGAASWQLQAVAQTTRDARARTLATRLATEAAADRDWLGKASDAPLIELHGYLQARRERANAALVEAMLVSQRIYRPFVNSAGEAWLANAERETLMKITFLERYRAAERADRAPPRVMLKFGSYHGYRGATPTHVQGLGGFVTEFAHTTGQGGALTIATLCGPGGFVGNFDNPSISCDAGFAEQWPFLAPFVDPQNLTIFDVRVWKLRPRRWEHLQADVRQLLDSYDLLVVVPGGVGARTLSGLAAPRSPS